MFMDAGRFEIPVYPGSVMFSSCVGDLRNLQFHYALDFRSIEASNLLGYRFTCATAHQYKAHFYPD